jgi:ferredoxin
VDIRIDLDACEGHARCAAVAPELFDIYDDGLAYHTDLAREGRPEHHTLAVRAALSCPENAIIVADGKAEK